MSHESHLFVWHRFKVYGGSTRPDTKPDVTSAPGRDTSDMALERGLFAAALAPKDVHKSVCDFVICSMVCVSFIHAS